MERIPPSLLVHILALGIASLIAALLYPHMWRKGFSAFSYHYFETSSFHHQFAHFSNICCLLQYIHTWIILEISHSVWRNHFCVWKTPLSWSSFCFLSSTCTTTWLPSLLLFHLTGLSFQLFSKTFYLSLPFYLHFLISETELHVSIQSLFHFLDCFCFHIKYNFLF